MLLLVASLLALLVGPVLIELFGRARTVAAAFDGFVLVTIGGLVLLHLIPAGLDQGGWAAGVAGLVGLAVPFLVEGRLHRAHGALLWMVVLGLAAHAVSDGAALFVGGDVHAGHGHGAEAHAGHDHGPEAGEASTAHLALGVILHRLPFGLFLWIAIRPTFGTGRTLALMALEGGATFVGYGLGPVALEGLTAEALAVFQTFVAGSLLHVVLHHGMPGVAEAEADHDQHAHHHHDHPHDALHPHGHDHAHEHGHDHAHGHGHGHAHGHDHDHGHGHHHDHAHGHDHHHDHAHGHDHLAPPHVRREKLQPRTERAFASLGALGGLGVLVALSHVDRLGTGSEELRAGDAFLTLALESAPALLFAFVAAGLLQAFLDPRHLGWLGRGRPWRQAVRGMAFGLPLPVCSCGVLPLYTTLARAGVPATAGIAFLVATPELGLDALLISLPLLGSDVTAARLVAATLVALGTAWIVGRSMRTLAPPPPLEGAARHLGPWPVRLKSGLRFGLTELVDHTLPWILVGLGLAALLEPALSGDTFANLPSWLAVPVLAAAGAPLYVCASGATPLVAVLLHKGVSAGAALAFLLTGPATNATTFGVLARLHGKRVAVLFALTVTGLAIGLGWGVDALMPSPNVPSLHHQAAEESHVLAWICLGMLTILLGASLLRQGPRGMVRQITRALHVHP